MFFPTHTVARTVGTMAKTGEAVEDHLSLTLNKTNEVLDEAKTLMNNAESLIPFVQAFLIALALFLLAAALHSIYRMCVDFRLARNVMGHNNLSSRMLEENSRLHRVLEMQRVAIEKGILAAGGVLPQEHRTASNASTSSASSTTSSLSAAHQADLVRPKIVVDLENVLDNPEFTKARFE